VSQAGPAEDPGRTDLNPEPEGPRTVEELVRQSLSTQLGGARGSLEAAVPTVVFVIVWTAGHQVRAALIASVAAVAVLLVARLAQRQSPRFVLSSLVALVIAAYFVHRSGRAQDAFLPGIIYSSFVGVLTLISVVARWPLVGFIVGAAAGGEDPLAWHRDGALVRLCQRLTLVLVGMYAVRLGIMVPLYAAGDVAALGVAKIVLSWPLYGLAVAAMGLILVRGHTPLEPADDAIGDSAG
jgi:hypothetical protein